MLQSIKHKFPREITREKSDQVRTVVHNAHLIVHISSSRSGVVRPGLDCACTWLFLVARVQVIFEFWIHLYFPSVIYVDTHNTFALDKIECTQWKTFSTRRIKYLRSNTLKSTLEQYDCLRWRKQFAMLTKVTILESIWGQWWNIISYNTSCLLYCFLFWLTGNNLASSYNSRKIKNKRVATNVDQQGFIQLIVWHQGLNEGQQFLHQCRKKGRFLNIKNKKILISRLGFVTFNAINRCRILRSISFVIFNRPYFSRIHLRAPSHAYQPSNCVVEVLRLWVTL